MRRLAAPLAFTIATALTVRAQADLVISFAPGPVTIQAGNTAPSPPIVVTISGSSPVNEFEVAFDITRDPSNPLSPVAFPSFVTPDTATDPTLHDPHYIFFTDSLSQDNAQFGTASDPGTGFKTHFDGGDQTISGDDVTITPPDNHLADLQVNSTVSTITNPGGDLYDLTIDLALSHFFSGNNVEYTSGISVDPLNNRTLIRVVEGGVPAVPEPGTMTYALSTAALLSGWWLYRRRRDGRLNLAGRGGPSAS